MYEHMTYETIMKRVLSRISDKRDKRQGSPDWDSTAPVAVEMTEMYIELDNILKMTFAETAAAKGYSKQLEKRCSEMGVHREPATAAVRLGLFYTGSSSNRQPFDVPIGSRYSIETETLNYVVTEKIDTGQFRLQCEETGILGNQLFGRLIPIDTVRNLTYAELADVLIPGEDEEPDERLYARYEKAVNEQPYGGNIADYKRKVNALDGVEDCKVFPVWDGGGTVKVVLITTEYEPPSQVLIDDVQEKLDPVPYHGQGKGQAPIGHWVTVTGVEDININVETTLILRQDTTLGQVQPEIEEVIQGYFLELAMTWAEQDEIIIRISQVEAKILNVTGIIDISDTTLNGGTSNIILGSEQIPVPGRVTLHG